MTAGPDAPASPVRHYLTLGLGAAGTMFDVALVVLGSVLLGLAAAVLLDGFGLVTLGLDLSTGAMLGSALVIGIVGGFALGIASEGPLGRGRRLIGYAEVEVGVARLVAGLLVGAILMLLASYLGDLVVDLPVPFEIAIGAMRAVGVAGMTVVPLVGIPLAWTARSGYLGAAFALDGDIPILYMVWAVTTMAIL